LTNEKNLSAQKKKKKQNTRLFETVKICRRPGGFEAAQKKRQKKTHGLAKMAGFLIVRRRFGGKGGAIVISKGVAKKAVTRNLIKRRIRAAMRALLPKKEIQNYTIFVNPGSAKLTYQDFKNELAAKLRSKDRTNG
jgi:ribonuclease P protein component